MYTTLNNILDEYDVGFGETVRFDCPVCGGLNTFSISNIGGSIVWNCYKASCDVSGTRSKAWTIDDLDRMREGQKEKPFVLPEYIVPCNQFVGDWADSWDLNAIDLGLMWDAKEERAVFLVKDGDKIVDATGRALTKRQPKWKRYGSSSLPYACGSGAVAVVVEDCVSAAVVAEVKNCVGVALLGTSLNDTHKQYLSQFSTILVALDPDAILKSAYHAQQLELYVDDIHILNLQKDLKYRNPNDIHRLGEMAWN